MPVSSNCFMLTTVDVAEHQLETATVHFMYTAPTTCIVLISACVCVDADQSLAPEPGSQLCGVSSCYFLQACQ